MGWTLAGVPVLAAITAGVFETSLTIAKARHAAEVHAELLATHARYHLQRVDAALEGAVWRAAATESADLAATFEAKRRRGELATIYLRRADGSRAGLLPDPKLEAALRQPLAAWKGHRIGLTEGGTLRPQLAFETPALDETGRPGLTIAGLDTDRFSVFAQAVRGADGLGGLLLLNGAIVAAANPSSGIAPHETIALPADAGDAVLKSLSSGAGAAFVAVRAIDGTPFSAAALFPAAPLFWRLGLLWLLLALVSAGAGWAARRMTRLDLAQARQSNATLALVRDIAKAQDEAVALFGKDERLQIANTRAHALARLAGLNLRRGETLAGVAERLLSSAGRPFPTDHILGLLRAAPGHLRIETGGHIWSLRAEPAPEGRLVVTLKDVTRFVTRERMLERLLRENRSLAAAADASGAGLVVVRRGPGGAVITQFNDAARRLTGGDPCAMPLHDWLVDVEQGAERLRLFQAAEDGEAAETELTLPGGRILQARAAPLDGDAAHSVIVLMDVSTREIAKARAVQSQRLEALGQLAGGLAHEYNNLLSIVGGYSGLARSQVEPGSAPHTYLGEVIEAAARGARLTRELLAFGRKGQEGAEIFDLSLLVHQQDSLLRPLLGQTYTLTIDAEGPAHVKASRDLVAQALMNLTVNARDAMPDGGRIAIKVRREQGRVTASISDTGCGMDAPTKARAFEPFFTTKEAGKGTGLGLAFVFGVMRQAEGSVSIDSAPGAGTRVTLDFAQSPPPPPRASVTGPAESGFAGRLALVAEDEPQLRRLYGMFLAEAGFETILAEDGDDALAKLEQHGGSPDLLLTDAIMPGLGGPQLAELVQALHPDVRIVAVTGTQDRGERLRAAFPQDVPIIAKPAWRDAILAAIARALDPAAEAA
jgi:signal transduction histidine kinase/ActR/RegA family two-component response regulator